MADVVVVVASIPLIGIFIYAIYYDGLKTLKRVRSNKSSNRTKFFHD